MPPAHQLRPLPELLRAGAGRAGIAFADVRREVTHAELAARTERIAGHLADLGVRPADRVAVLIDGVAGVESVLAAVRAGAVAVPLDSTVDDGELARLLADAGATTVVTDAAGAARVSPRTLIVDGPYDGAALDYEMLATTDPVSAARDGAELDGVAFLCYSAGVTGPRRGVLTTQRNVLWSALGSYADVLSEKHRLLWSLPLHCGVGHLFAAVSTGAPVWLAAGLNPTEVRHAIAEQQSTVVAASAAMFGELRRVAASVRFGLLVGSGRADPEFPLLNVYTTTETAGPVAMSRPGDDGLVPLPGVTVCLAADGEVLVSGPTVAASAALHNGWYHTGDLGTCDAVDRLTVTGRIADLVRVGDELVRLEQVDAALRSVDGVRDAAIAHGPVAYVVADGVDAARLFAACRAELAAAAVPAELYAVREIPRTATGSPLRHRLPALPARLLGVAASAYETLFAQHWEPLPEPTGAPDDWAVAGPAELTAGLDVPGFVIDGHTDFDTLSDLVTYWPAGHTGKRLVLLTHGAVHAGGYAPDPARAAAWGMGRAQQAHHPGRLVLVDADAVTEDLLAAAVASGENELAVRGGQLLRPNHTSVPAASAGPALSGTVVLVAGDAWLARHLVSAHGVGELVVVGAAVPDVPATTRPTIAEALAEWPVDAVVGVNLTPGEAQELHEATLPHTLTAFVLLTSGADPHTTAVADALARHRRTLELPAVSITWTSPGFTELPPSWRTTMLDAALAAEEPCVVAGLHGNQQSDAVRATLRERVLAAPDRQQVLLDVLNTELTGVLARNAPVRLAPSTSFHDLGLDWLTTARLRTRLCVATGLDLPATLLTHHPTPAQLAEHLLGLLNAPGPAVEEPVVQQEEAVAPARPAPQEVVPWLLSAGSEQELREEAAWLASAAGELDVAEVGRALLASRPARAHRVAVTGTNREELVAGLHAVARGDTPSTVVTGTSGLAFLFAGQGAQRIGMGAELSAVFPTFAASLAETCAALDPHLPSPLQEALNSATLHRTVFAQPALFAVEVALFRLLESWGVRPDYVAGHGSGELAAAHVAGVWSLADAARMVATRAKLTQGLPEHGAMVAVHATEAQVRPLLSDRMAIAAINGPAALVLSGEAGATLAAAEELADTGHKTRLLPVSHALHSPLMDPILPQLLATAATLTRHEPTIPLISTLTGAAVDPTPAHWAEQARSPIRFTDALATLTANGVSTFVELGPAAVLTPLTRDCVPADRAVFPTLTTKHAETWTITKAFGHLFTRGYTVDSAAFFPDTPPANLPPHPVDKNRTART